MAIGDVEAFQAIVEAHSNHPVPEMDTSCPIIDADTSKPTLEADADGFNTIYRKNLLHSVEQLSVNLSLYLYANCKDAKQCPHPPWNRGTDTLGRVTSCFYPLHRRQKANINCAKLSMWLEFPISKGPYSLICRKLGGFGALLGELSHI